MIGCGRFLVVGSRGDARARPTSDRTSRDTGHDVPAAADGVAVEPAEGEGVVEAGQRASAGEASSEITERLPALLLVDHCTDRHRKRKAFG
jgi:hypothetical protein